MIAGGSSFAVDGMFASTDSKSFSAFASDRTEIAVSVCVVTSVFLRWIPNSFAGSTVVEECRSAAVAVEMRRMLFILGFSGL